MSIVADAADGAMSLTHGRYPDRPRSKAHSQKLRASNSSMRTAVGPGYRKAHQHGKRK